MNSKILSIHPDTYLSKLVNSRQSNTINIDCDYTLLNKILSWYFDGRIIGTTDELEFYGIPLNYALTPKDWFQVLWNYTESLSQSQKDVIVEYSITTEDINRPLREKSYNHEELSWINSLIEIIKNSQEVVISTTLFRGTDNFKPIRTIKVGETFTDLGFMSKSLSVEVVKKKFQKQGKFLIMSYPFATKQLLMAPVSEDPSELEIISFPGEIFRVTNIEGDNIYMEYIGNYYDKNGVFIL